MSPFGALFDDAAGIHHRDAPGDAAHHREIMRDEEIAQAELLLQVQQQIDDLGLHRNVERRDRFVADDEFRPQRERAGNADALSLAAGEFMRVAVAAGAGQADDLQQFDDAIGALFSRNAAGDIERLGDAVVDAHARIERTIGILKHELQAAADVREMFCTILAGDGFAEQFDVASGRRDQADQQPADGRFAGAGFADQAKRFPGRDIEADLVDRMKLQRRAALVGPDRENLDEVANPGDWRGGGAHGASTRGGQRAKRAGPAGSRAGASMRH